MDNEGYGKNFRRLIFSYSPLPALHPPLSPLTQVGYTPAMLRREDHEVNKGHVLALDQKKIHTLIRHNPHRGQHT